ncbi:hypothetical protein EON68_05095, partial [archaeon]
MLTLHVRFLASDFSLKPAEKPPFRRSNRPMRRTPSHAFMGGVGVRRMGLLDRLKGGFSAGF